MKVVTAVLAYNGQTLVDSMLEQLGNNVCIIDNGSTPPLHTPSGQHIRLPENRYFTGGWNSAMTVFYLRDYKWCWMLNSDLKGVSPVDADLLVDLAESLPNCVAISPAYNSPHAHMHNRYSNSTWEVKWLDWAGPLVNVDWFINAGRFDEQFIGYGSDIELCRRVQGTDAKFYVTDKVTFHHLGGTTAINEGISQHTDVEYMNALLRQKYGTDWTGLFS